MHILVNWGRSVVLAAGGCSTPTHPGNRHGWRSSGITGTPLRFIIVPHLKRWSHATPVDVDTRSAFFTNSLDLCDWIQSDIVTSACAKRIRCQMPK
ncbi:hypothetical protein EVAR_82066_1 [Eumeta japonica]|uniref:Uncharacterized protein n=1 Tax=Eumeta variegata TaxID=151549 RepID=A0A4C1U1F8_EUMVA|nr:hypothetical protein EVAR_82066_1 [Eumeta japonica]